MFHGGIWAKLRNFYKWYVLGLVSVGYILGELGHYLIGTTSKVTAEDLHYGDKACMLNATHLTLSQLPVVCEKVNSSDIPREVPLRVGKAVGLDLGVGFGPGGQPVELWFLRVAAGSVPGAGSEPDALLIRGFQAKVEQHMPRAAWLGECLAASMRTLDTGEPPVLFNFPCRGERRALPWSTFKSLATRGNDMITRSKTKKTDQANMPISADETASQISPTPPPRSIFSLTSSPVSYQPSSSRSSLSSLSEPRSVDVVIEADTAENSSPATGTTNARKKWSEEMNKFILRQYLIITNLETDTNSYLTTLHQKFIEKFPNMNVSKQRIGDQRRAIVNKNLLPATTINTIRLEVRSQLQTQNIDNSNTTHFINFTPQNAISSENATHSQPRSRMKWSNEVNETLIKCYYLTTKMETDMTVWRKRLREMFVEHYPHLQHLSEQRISDQKRVIFNNKMIPEARLQIIKATVVNVLNDVDLCRQADSMHKNEIEINTSALLATNENLDTELEQRATQEIDMGLISNPFDNLDIENLSSPNSQHIIHNNLENERNAEIDLIFSQTLEHYTNIHPTKRNYIPKQRTSAKLGKIVTYINNKILPQHINKDTVYEALQTIIYCAAWTAAKANGSKISYLSNQNETNQHKTNKPKWQNRLENKIKDLRAKIGRLTQYIQGKRSRKVLKEVQAITENYRTHTSHEEPNSQLTHFLDTLKQKLTVVSSRLNRYTKCTIRKSQNNQFKNNEKQFYRQLNNSSTNRTNKSNNTESNVPPADEMRRYWADIWENPTYHNNEASWINTEIENSVNIEQMKFEYVQIDTFQDVIRNSHNWKAPGSDFIHNFWYKKFTYIHPYLYNYINEFIRDPTIMPAYITEGITYMLPKDRNNLNNPAKYRPITCLQTIYKIITSCITHIIYKHLETNNIISEEQKGCRKYSQGCKEQLTIDAVILKQVERNKTNLCSMYIDYKKAYDSVPHSWLLKVLDIYKVHPQLTFFLSNIIKKWTTRLHLNTTTDLSAVEPIKILRGIYQGDSLSPLWFCLALNPLSNRLNAMKPGYILQVNDTTAETQTDKKEHKINHLLYMDDIKLYASSPEELLELANITEEYSNDITMQFGIDKCKINSIIAGKHFDHSYEMQTGEIIQSLEEKDTYKYLGYIQNKQIQHKEIKLKLTKQFKHRLNSILNTQLHAKNTIKAINTYAIPTLTYSFGIINWTKTELKNLQRMINTSMTKHRKHHPRSCVQRLTLPRKEGGRGIIDITNLHNKQITTLRKYFHSKSTTSELHKAIVFSDRKYTPLNMCDRTTQSNERQTDGRTKVAEWARKSLHGRHHHDLIQQNVDKLASNEWLSHGDLFPETEGFMVAIQDQVIETRNYQRHIIRAPIPTDLCRRCNSASETIQHITGACKAIVQTDYKHRHDQISNIIHQKLALKYKLITTPAVPYYKYTPEVVLENTTHKLYFDRAILTDKTTHFNRPDVTLVDKVNKTAQIIDIAVPNTHNLQNTIAEKLSKYTDLKIELTRMWKLNNVTIIPVVISTTGVIPRQLHHSLKILDIPPKTYLSLQKAAILNTCRIVRKFLQNDTDAQPTISFTQAPIIPPTH
ncbi:unnamed protein product [Euphydryas editha]|uniref:Reverse transcriptase domain-containing protein n=1 Tax=Euphydryas editha TaxID=104508 RepID=A0AAU9U4J1_EUPED|nr:unnamed protein product [Euphydryas editha]